ncbi:DNA-binding response regulator [Cupriavidus pauculus]|uniref:DNA-binding response regulator n=2 Tax=Burkholderiaceae TaxID=119060 RepID=A0A3G8H8U3_9BURK|nr:DNA-binding response regulator [Cupriavidus pauculus]
MLADDHPFIVFGVREILSRQLGFSVVAEAANPPGLMDNLSRIECDVVITDFSMPGSGVPDGLVLLNAIRAKFPAVRIVVLTMLDNPGLLLSMRRAGALALLNKRDDMRELPAAVIAAFQGREHLGATMRRAITRPGPGTSQNGSLDTLSPREMEVLRLYVGGMTTSEVARHLNRSINTVSTQKHSAMRKLGVKNDAELFDYASEHGLRA